MESYFMRKYTSLGRCLAVVLILLCASLTFAGHLTTQGDQLLYEGEPVKLIGLRCSNALISDQTTDDLIGALDLYQSYGLNTVSVFVMGSRFGDVKGYLPDTSMDPVYLGRLERILNATQSRDMMMVVGCLYWSVSKAKEELSEWTQDDANRAIAGTARWLADKDYKNVILDPDNEGMAGREMNWETEPMIQAAHKANPTLLVANNTKMKAPGADLNMHFGPKVQGKPWLNSESTPPGKTSVGAYWGRFSKENHNHDASFYNYSRIGRYTEEMKQSQIKTTRDLIDNHSGILLASTWLQCSSEEGIGGPFVLPGGLSKMGSNEDIQAVWNQHIDQLHPDAGIRWWLEFVKQNYGTASAVDDRISERD
jgi:hypothetical protein